MELNLCKILKGHEGETFYSPTFGYLRLVGIYIGALDFSTITEDEEQEQRFTFYSNGTYVEGAEVSVFPSKDQRDWNKWDAENNWKAPKTWSEFVKQNKINTYILGKGYGEVNFSTEGKTPIEKSALAHLKILQLIEIGYGGIINKDKISYHTAGITSNLDIVISEEYDEDFYALFPLIFKSTAEAKEFLLYPENIQLIKNLYGN